MNIQVKEGKESSYRDTPFVDVQRLEIERNGQRFVIKPARGGGITVSAYDTLEIRPEASNRVLLKEVDIMLVV